MGFWCVIVITADPKSFENEDVLYIFCTLAQNNKVNLKGKVSTAARPGGGHRHCEDAALLLCWLCAHSPHLQTIQRAPAPNVRGWGHHQ